MAAAVSRTGAVEAETTVAADDEGVAAATAFATRYASDRGLAMAIQMRLALVVEELVSNVAKYGYNPGAPRGHVTLRFGLANGRLELEVIDDGRAFDPLSAPAPDLTASAERRPIGGLGIHLVRSLAETVRYERIAERNHLTLALRI